MRSLAWVENARAERLAAVHEDLSLEARRLSRESLEDALTGLANRRRLDQLLAELATEGNPYAIAILDLDHFKFVNDRYSHAVGDRVLRQVGETLRSTLAPLETLTVRLAVRLGGEEFAIALAAAGRPVTLPEARAVCEAIRCAITTYEWGSIVPWPRGHSEPGACDVRGGCRFDGPHVDR